MLPAIVVQGNADPSPGVDAPHDTTGEINLITPDPPDTSVFPPGTDRPGLRDTDDSAATRQIDALTPDAIAAFESTRDQPPATDQHELEDTDTSAPTGQIDALIPDATVAFESTRDQPPATDQHELEDIDASAPTGHHDEAPSHDEPTAITTVIDAVLVDDDLPPLDPNDGAEPPPATDQPDDQPDEIERAVAAEPEAKPKRPGLFGRRRDRRRAAAAAEPSVAPAPPAIELNGPSPEPDPAIAGTSSLDEQPAVDLDPVDAGPQTTTDEPIFVSRHDVLFDHGDSPGSEFAAPDEDERRPRRNVTLPPDAAEASASTEPARPATGMFDDDIESDAEPADPQLGESAGFFSGDDAPGLVDEPPAQPVSQLFGGLEPDVDSGLVDDAAAAELGEALASSAFDTREHAETSAVVDEPSLGPDGHDQSETAGPSTDSFDQIITTDQGQDEDDADFAGPSTGSIDQIIGVTDGNDPLTGSSEPAIDALDNEFDAAWADDSWVDPTQDEQPADLDETDLERADLALFPDRFPPLPSDAEGPLTVASDDLALDDGWSDGFALDDDWEAIPVRDRPAWTAPDTLTLFDPGDQRLSPRSDGGSWTSPATDSEFFSLEAALASLPAPSAPVVALMGVVQFDAPPARSSDEPAGEHQPAPDPVVTPFDLADVPEEPGLEVEVALAATAAANQLVTAGAPITLAGADPLTHHGASNDVFAELAELDGRHVDDPFDTQGHEIPEVEGDERIDQHDWWDFDDITQRDDDRAGFRAAADATAAIDLTGTEQIRLGTSDLATPPTATKSSDLDSLDGPESEAYEAALYAFFDTPAHEGGDDEKRGDGDAGSDDTIGKAKSKRWARRKAKALDKVDDTNGETADGDDLFAAADRVADDGKDDLDRWVEGTEDTHADWLERTKRSTISNLLGVLIALAAVVGLVLATVWVVSNL